MNTNEMMPTEENLIKAIEEDLLERNMQLGYFYQLLLSLETATAISIDGRWGSGKTFFVKQEMLLINAKNPNSTMDEEKRKLITNSIRNTEGDSENSNDENYDLAIYYDAWENDNDTEPVFSIIYEIAKEVGLTYPFKGSTNAFKTAGAIIEAIQGKNVNGIIEHLKSDNPLSDFHKQKELQKQIKDFLSELINENGNRLIVFIDELDRCKPTYAVHLLEQIKHYLCDERITFVFSINKVELQHTIKNYYGLNFDACRYLDRFFDIPISLSPADMRRFYEKIGLDSGSFVEALCKRIIEVYHFELREITRYYQIVKTAIYMPTHDSEERKFNFYNQEAKKLVLFLIVPIVMGLHIADTKLYYEFIHGENSQPLEAIFEEEELYDWLYNMIFRGNYGYGNGEEKENLDKKEVLQEIYRLIFVYKYLGREPYIFVGRYRFSAEIKPFILDVVSSLTKYADYRI